MKKLIFTIAIVLVGAANTYSQDVECPISKVCLSPEAAQAALVAHQTVIAQQIEINTLRNAVLDQKEVAESLKIELAKTTGMLTGEQQQNVSNRAIISLMIPMLRQKKFGLINLF